MLTDSVHDMLVALEENAGDVFLEVSEVLVDIINNILSDTANLSFRTVSLDGDVCGKLLPACGGMQCLFEMGFEEADDRLVLPIETPLHVLEVIRAELIERRERYYTEIKLIQEANRRTDPPPSNTMVQNLHKINPFLKNIEMRFQQARHYLDDILLERARNVIPLVELKTEANRLLQVLKTENPQEDVHLDELLMHQLLKWFKEKFFKWVDTPNCRKCEYTTVYSDTDIIEGVRREIYCCERCHTSTYFFRYNNPGKLLETREGRCGEWGNAFTLLCCALGWDARYIVDESDHVWTEVYMESKRRWVHCDPCEPQFDTPLMYEVGWKKQLTYVIAYSPYEVQDVTWRYSCDHLATRKRRQKCNETDLVNTIVNLRHERQKDLPQSRIESLTLRLLGEIAELMTEKRASQMDRCERQSGSLAWRLARGETSITKHLMPRYRWEPIGNRKWLSVRYSCALNCYQQVSNQGKLLQRLNGWENGICEGKAMFRKEEHDWKNVYLARIDGSSDGKISWNFGAGHTDWLIENIIVKFVAKTFENGQINVTLSDGVQDVTVNTDGVIFTTNTFTGSSAVTLVVTLSGGKGDVAWQHAQLFRDSMTSEEFPFIVTITFRPKAT